MSISNPEDRVIAWIDMLDSEQADEVIDWQMTDSPAAHTEHDMDGPIWRTLTSMPGGRSPHWLSDLIETTRAHVRDILGLPDLPNDLSPDWTSWFGQLNELQQHGYTIADLQASTLRSPAGAQPTWTAYDECDEDTYWQAAGERTLGWNQTPTDTP